MESSENLKARILEMGPGPSDDGMQADSPGYATEETIELDSDQEEEVEVSEDDEEEQTAEELLRELQGKLEENTLSGMDARQRSHYREAKRSEQQREISEYVDRFDKDTRETGLELSEFPLVTREFSEEYYLGKVKMPSNEVIAGSESPTLEVFASWLSQNPNKVLKLLERENPSEPSHERLGKLINTIKDAPAIGGRVRNKLFGFDQPQEKPMSKKQIDDTIESYFSKE